MPDRANNKTKRRRKSKAKKKNNNNNNTATSSATVCDNAPVDELNVPDVCCDNPEPEPEPEPEPTNICDNETFEEHINKKFYKVESPDRELLQVKKANNLSKSKSLDDDDGPLNITEVTDHPENVNTAINESNAIVSEAESDVDWETTDELQSDIAVIDTAQGILSIETISLDCAEVEETNSLSPEEEKSLRMYLGTLNLATGPDQTAEALPRKEIHILDQSEKIMILKLKKARKKAEIENYSPTKPRLLDVIDEEGSNESSSTTRRDSFLKDTTYDDLEDDVFIDPKKPPPTPIEYFLMPKTRIRRSELNQAQECFLLGTKLVDSSVEQGCADWTIEKTDELRGAEVVYLDDSSSSTSEVYDTEGGDADIETEEESVRIQTPVIEFDMGDPVNVKENIMEDVFSLPEEIPVTCNEVILVATDSENDSGKETFSETKIEALKKELDDALKDLLENSDENSGGFIRQDSSSSVCSSQSTAKYNPSSSSLIDITTVLHDEVKSDPVCANNETFSAIEVVKPDVPYFPGDVLIQPSNLKDICVRKIASLPYGSAILEELASVAKSLELYNTSVKTAPDVPPRTRSIKMGTKVNPPLPPRQSSLHIAKEEQKWVGLVTKSDPSLLACLSPSQRQEIERSKKQPGADEAGLLIDMHTKYLDRRGYHEYITNGTHTSDSKNTDDKTSMQANRTTQAPRNDGFGNRLLAIIQDPSLKNGIAPHPLNNNSVIKNESIECSEHYTSEKSYKATISNKKQSTTDTKFETSATYNQSDPKKVEYSKTSSYSVSKDDEIGNLQRKRNFILDDPIFNRDKRRSSLPRDLYEKQMEYILRKEKEIEEEIKKLEADKRSSSCENKKKSTRKAPLLSDEEFVKESCVFDARKYFISRQGDVATIQSSNHADSERGKSVPTISSNEERFRQEMYSEYMDKVAEREERKQHKVIKITGASSGSLPILNDITQKEIKQTCGLIEEEFITKAKERWEKLGFKDPETEDEKEKAVDKLEDVYKESTVSERKKIKVIDGGEEKEIAGLPSHLREFVQFTANDTSSPETVMFAPTFKARAPSPAFWTPGTPTPASENQLPTPRQPEPPAPPPPPVWTPSSAEPSPQAQRKFRPVSFESPKLVRKIQQAERAQENQGPPPPSPVILNGSASQTGFHPPPPPPLTASLDRRLPTSHSAPCAGLNAYSTTSRLPKAQNPTITLLQKAREGQLPRGASYLSENHHSTDFRARKSTPPRAETGYSLRKGYVSEGEGEESRRRRMADVGHSKIDGVGPTTKDGMPVALRSEVKDQSKWYKKMYDTIHRNKYDGDYVTVRYKSHRGQDSLERARTPRSSQYAYFDPRSGYLSEPGGGGWSDAYESDAAPRRRRTTSAQLEQEEVHSEYLPSNKYSTLASAKASKEIYKNQPGKIENYVPGRSSVVEKESKQWWDEVMDIFDGQLSHSTLQPPSIRDKKDLTSSILSKSNMARALKESGYESDSTLVFRRRSPIEAPLSPDERRQAYRSLQAGGEPPLHGFRKPAPERPRDDAEIEYFPLSPTLTRIRVHRNIPQQEAAVCYPITKVSPTSEQVFARYKRSVPSFIGFDEPKLHLPPAPPRRQSSKASSTLRMVSSVAPKRAPTRYASRSPDDSNIKFLQNRIQNKLSHATMKDLKQKEVKEVKMKSSDGKKVKTTRAALSVSPSPTRSKTVPRIKPDRPKGTSSFAAPRRTLSPIEYSNPEISRYEEATGRRIPIEGGAGRRTPITGMLDRATYLDKYRASTLPSRLSRSVELKSSKVPYVRKQSPGLIVRNTTAMYSSAKNGNSPNQDKSLKVTVAMSRRGRELLRASDKFLNGRSSPKLQPRIPSPSLTFSLNTSVDSLASVSTIKTGKKSVPAKIDTRIKKKLTNGDSTAKKKTQAKLTKTVEKTARKPISTKLTKIIKPKTSETKLSSDLRMDGSSDSNFGSFMNLNSEEIQRQREAIMTDSFFQHLFLRDEPPIPSYNITPAYHNTTVLEKARLFQNYPEEHIINKYINTYLSHKKPVSESKFRIMEKFNDQRSRSPRSISWPGRMTDPTVKRLHYYPDIKTLQERSKSEPPHSKIVLSETTRPKSPTIVFKRVEKPSTIVISNRRHESPPAKIIFTQTSRPVSPVVFRKKQEKPVQIPRPTSPAKIIFTQTSRPVSPVVRRRSDMKQMSRSLSPGLSARQPDRMVFTETSRPVSPTIYFKPKTASDESLNRSRSHSPTARSPSCRRIQSARNYKGQEYINAVRKRVLRTRSAGDADTRLYRTSSNSSLHLEDYLLDPKLSRSRAERFRELNKFYSLWERAGELEKVTSAHDLRPRRKDKEIIDFDDWKQFRAKERAEEELERLYSKIKAAQDESDVLFYPKDPRSIKWDYQKDRNLYIKDKSVEDLRDHFQKYTDFDSEYDRKYDLSTDIYKPLWRGTSVINLASNLSKKDDRFEKHSKTRTKPTVITFKPNMTDLRHKLGIGSRLWSSLSMEQVNTLKNQLNAIYSKDSDTKAKRDSDASDQYVINVTDSMTAQPSTNLQVRCSSFTSGDQSTLDRKTDQIKADSISAINWQVSSEKDAKNVVNSKCQILSENEKKRISKSLSKEVLDRVKQKEKYPPILLARETRGATVSARIQGLARSLSETGSPRTCYSLEHSEDEKSPMKNGHVLVLTPSTDNKTNEEIKSVLNGWAKPVRASPASETETASSDFSNKTVIYRGSKEEVLKKIEYFEKIKDDKPVTATVYYPHDEEVAKEVDEKEKEKEKTADVLPVIPIPPPPPLPEPTAKKLVPSQSCSDFKELFGETEKYKYASLPIRIASPLKLRDESASPSRFSYISSTDSLFRSRSPSPDLERYWRAYLNIVKSGDVKRLKRRFESPSYYDIDSDFPRLRRHQSDPEIARSLLKKNWNSIRKITIKKHEYGDVDRLTHKYEASTRGRSRIRRGGISPIPKVPIRFDDRFMPHIDVISKLAALKRRSNTAPARSSYAGYPMECPVGEVGRIKTEFEKMSILGQMFTSAPDVHELRDIAPYLAGSWIAHKYPSRQDNNRTLDETGYVSEDRYSPVRKISERPKSASPVKLSSILKQDLPKSGDIFADQPFDPAMHRPISRYQPPPPPRPAWPEVMTTYTARPTVTFQEPEWSPTPSLKNFLYDSDYSPESPRRYVESDVNIHYRVPVVQEPRPLVPEHELARRQAEHMKRVYQEERRRKYLQELQDMNSRRHADNFTPSQKSPIPLHRYDDLDKYPADIPNKTLTRALYNFSGQNQKELTFKKGDLIILRRQVDPNWYEGEVNGRVGIFPKSYVETYRSPAPPSSAAPTGSRYGRARALYDFTAQTRLELPLKRGQLVALTRRIDKNWWEGRSQDGTTGIFPESYIEVLQEPLGTTSPGHAIMELTRSSYSEGSRPIGSPAAHSVIRGTGKQSMGGHHYTPQHNSPSLNAPGSTEPLSSARPIIPKAQRSPILPRAVLNSGRKSQSQSYGSGIDLNNTQPLYVDTNADAVPYRAMYKYRPQNTDELELLEGDTVYVLEKCDDGWYVGSSQRTGNFGTFPGNYVTKI